MVGGTNIYGDIFYQIYLLPQLTIHFFTWFYGIIVMLYLDSVSPPRLYQYMQKYVVIVLMKLDCSNQGENLIHDSICIIFWRNMCRVPFRE